MSRALKVYNTRLVVSLRGKLKKLFSQKYLLYTNTAISVFMSCAGDGLQQNYQIAQKEIACWDKRRSRDVAVTGFLIGPFCHYWYILLDWWLPGRSVGIIMKKLLVDQFICSPVAITSFLSVTSYLEGKRGKELKNELIEKGKTLYAAEWIVWPPAQIVNFYFLPTKYRVLFDNSVSFGFDWYFSYVKYGKQHHMPGDILESSHKENIEDEALHISQYGSHIPFLHIQAADTLQTKLDQDLFDDWSKWYHRGNDLKHNGTDEVTETNDVIESNVDEKAQDTCGVNISELNKLSTTNGTNL
ncbi:mpv17-like protein 2 [Ruditapes philippinarum]|uniref:mpv17-like protein 2 n=1 Tax=Ruditapes philippinarum TaxID=129788 RepID=UPI00295B426C|nr:mpv17-like protein 2 [Ruditapes philippinarum]